MAQNVRADGGYPLVSVWLSLDQYFPSYERKTAAKAVLALIEKQAHSNKRKIMKE